MPRYTDPATGRSIRSDTPLSDADLEEAFSQHVPAAAAAATPSPDEGTTALGRAGSYLEKRANEFVGSAQNLAGDIEQGITGQKLFPGDRSTTERLQDVATVAAPVASLFTPIGAASYAGGALAGAGTRAAGGSEGTAQGVDVGVNLAGGLTDAALAVRNMLKLGSLPKAVKTLATATPEEAGEVLQANIPGAVKTTREAVQGKFYTPAAEFAEQHGLVLTPGTPEADRLGQRLLEADDKWGDLMRPAERRASQAIQERLTTPNAKPLTYAELDAHKLNLEGIRGASSVRGAIDGALDDIVQGTDAAGLRAGGAAAWARDVQPAQALGKAIRSSTKAGDPTRAFQIAGGSFSNPSKAAQAQTLLGKDSEEWGKVVGGFYGKLFEGTEGDAMKAVSRWNKVREPVRQLFDPKGTAGQMFDQMERLTQGTKGGQRVKGLVTAGTAATAGYEFYKGDYKTGLSILAAGALGRGVVPTGAAPTVWEILKAGAPGAARGAAGATAAEYTPPDRSTQGAPAVPETTTTTTPATSSTTTTTLPPPQPTGTSPAAPGGPGDWSDSRLADLVHRGVLNPDDAAHLRELRQQQGQAPSSTAPAPAAPTTGSRKVATLGHQMDAISNVVGIPSDLMALIMQRESAGKSDAVSEKGARGLMQIMPDTFDQYAKRIEKLTGRPADIDDPLDNMVAGALHLRDDLDATNGDVNAAARRYFAGPDPRLHGPKTVEYGNAIAGQYASLGGGAE
jgi:hypothetical protein